MLSSLFVSALLAAPALAASAEEWRNRTIYQLVTDRFALTNDSSGPCDTSNRVYCGGSWQGVINHLDYIQNMGFDAVWISPVSTNFEGESAYGQAFHGYWPSDLSSVNSHFGSDDDLKSLASALHDRSMYLMIDVVVNHLVYPSNPPTFGDFNPFNTESDFHPECFISDYNNQTDVEQCWLGDTNLPLADTNTEDENNVSSLNSWIKNLVSTYGADGIRIDTVKHIRQDFWPDFASSAGVYTIGEVLHTDVNYIANYTQVLDGVLDYSTWYPLVSSFQSTSGNLSALTANYTQLTSSFKNGGFQSGSFLENHDQPRFQSMTTDQSLVKNAMTWPFVNDGIPILYYGQEQGYTGGADPANREALWPSGYEEDKDLVTHVKTLVAARKLAAAANSNFHSTATKFPTMSDESTIAVSKPPMLALLTNTGSSGSASFSTSGAGYSANEALVNVLTCDTVTADGSGEVGLAAKSGLPQVLLPVSALTSSGGVCTNLVSAAHVSARVPSAMVATTVLFALFRFLA